MVQFLSLEKHSLSWGCTFEKQEGALLCKSRDAVLQSIQSICFVEIDCSQKPVLREKRPTAN